MDNFCVVGGKETMDVKYICLWIIGVVAIPPFKYTTAMVFSKIQSFSILIFFPKKYQMETFIENWNKGALICLHIKKLS